MNPLFRMAVLTGVQKIVRLYINRENELVNSTDDKGRSPLMLAILKGHVEICRILLDAGANPRAVDCEGNDALSIATASDNSDLTLMLNSKSILQQSWRL